MTIRDPTVINRGLPPVSQQQKPNPTFTQFIQKKRSIKTNPVTHIHVKEYLEQEGLDSQNMIIILKDQTVVIK